MVGTKLPSHRLAVASARRAFKKCANQTEPVESAWGGGGGEQQESTFVTTTSGDLAQSEV